MLELLQYSFTKKELAKVHSLHLSYILTAGHAVNEINAIAPYRVFEDLRHFGEELERSFTVIRQATLLRHTVCKCYEFNELTSQYLGRAKKLFPSFAEVQRQKYANIARSIRSKRWVYLLRNKITFHYDADHILTEFGKISPTQSLTLIGGRMSINSAHLFCEEAVLFPFIHEFVNEDISVGLDEMIAFASSITEDIVSFYVALVEHTFRHYGILKQPKKIMPNAASIGVRGKSYIPLLIDEESASWRSDNLLR